MKKIDPGVFLRSLLVLLTLVVSMAMPRIAGATCNLVGLRGNGPFPMTVGYRSQGVRPLKDIVLLVGTEDLITLGYSQVGPIDFNWIADQVGTNCKSDFHINLGPVAMSRDTLYTEYRVASCSTANDCPVEQGVCGASHTCKDISRQCSTNADCVAGTCQSNHVCLGSLGFSCTTDSDCLGRVECHDNNHTCDSSSTPPRVCATDADCRECSGGSCDYTPSEKCVVDANCGTGTTNECHFRHCNRAPSPGTYNRLDGSAATGDITANDLGPEILAAEIYGAQGDLDFEIYLGLTPSNLQLWTTQCTLNHIPPYPIVGTLDFAELSEENGTCDLPGYGCTVIASIPVYVEDVAVVATVSTAPLPSTSRWAARPRKSSLRIGPTPGRTPSPSD